MIKSTEIDNQSEKPFKFILYASFQSLSESIGLELCESLQKYCVDRNLPTFQLIKRFSVGGDGPRAPRWDADYIRA